MGQDLYGFNAAQGRGLIHRTTSGRLTSVPTRSSSSMRTATCNFVLGRKPETIGVRPAAPRGAPTEAGPVPAVPPAPGAAGRRGAAPEAGGPLRSQHPPGARWRDAAGAQAARRCRRAGVQVRARGAGSAFSARRMSRGTVPVTFTLPTALEPTTASPSSTRDGKFLKSWGRPEPKTGSSTEFDPLPSTRREMSMSRMPVTSASRSSTPTAISNLRSAISARPRLCALRGATYIL
jgi:hypothetical protein